MLGRGRDDCIAAAAATAPLRLSDVPLDSEGARAFHQQRIALFSLVQLVLGTVVQGVVTFVHVTAAGTDLAAGSNWTVYVHLLVVATFIAIWARTRRGNRSAAELNVLDIVSVAVPALFSLTALWSAPPSLRPQQPLMVAITYLLILRAVLIPSTGRRTAGIGFVFTVIIAGWTYAHNMVHAPGNVSMAILAGVLVTAWSLMGAVIIAPVASHTIFGLRQKVREAMRVGQYTLLRKIGEGGMGVVWEAEHAFLRRRTAVKLLPAERAGEEAIQRFEREVRLTSTLTHPNTIAIYDYGRSADGIFYYAMEHLDGIDLQALVERDGPQPPGLVAHVLLQVCDALSEAHEVGLIHRDVKPANVFLCERGRVPFVAKVLDFGLVKRQDPAPSPSDLSTTDALRGTPLYMAPEAMTRPESVDRRLDLYAVGAVGYFLLTGRPVFESASLIELLAHHLQTKPARPSDRLGRPVHPVLEAIVLDCLAKDPEKRPRTAADLSRRFAEARSTLGFTPEMGKTMWPRYLALSERTHRAPEQHLPLTVRIPEPLS